MNDWSDVSNCPGETKNVSLIIETLLKGMARSCYFVQYPNVYKKLIQLEIALRVFPKT